MLGVPHSFGDKALREACCTWGVQQSSGHHGHKRIVCAVRAQVFAERRSAQQIFCFNFHCELCFHFVITRRVTFQQGDWSDEPLTSALSDTGGGWERLLHCTALCEVNISVALLQTSDPGSLICIFVLEVLIFFWLIWF